MLCENNCQPSLVAQKTKNLPAMQELRFNPRIGKIPWRRKWQPTPVFLPGEFFGQRSWQPILVWEFVLCWQLVVPHSSPLAWKIPWTEDPGGLQSMGSQRVWATSLSLFTFTHWRRKWQSAPVFLPGESQGQGSLVGCVYGVAQSRTQLKRLSSSSSSVNMKQCMVFSWPSIRVWLSIDLRLSLCQ